MIWIFGRWKSKGFHRPIPPTLRHTWNTWIRKPSGDEIFFSYVRPDSRCKQKYNWGLLITEQWVWQNIKDIKATQAIYSANRQFFKNWLRVNRLNSHMLIIHTYWCFQYGSPSLSTSSPSQSLPIPSWKKTRSERHRSTTREVNHWIKKGRKGSLATIRSLGCFQK